MPPVNSLLIGKDLLDAFLFCSHGLTCLSYTLIMITQKQTFCKGFLKININIDKFFSILLTLTEDSVKIFLLSRDAIGII